MMTMTRMPVRIGAIHPIHLIPVGFPPTVWFPYQIYRQKIGLTRIRPIFPLSTCHQAQSVSFLNLISVFWWTEERGIRKDDVQVVKKNKTYHLQMTLWFNIFQCGLFERRKITIYRVTKCCHWVNTWSRLIKMLKVVF